MVLEDLFRRPYELARFRKLPLGSEMDGFCRWLHGQGFSHSVIYSRVSVMSHLNEYFRRLGIRDCRCVERRHAEGFLSNQLRKRSHESFKNLARSARSFMKYFSERGILTSVSETVPPYQGVLEEYLNHLRGARSLTESTIRIYLHYLRPLLDSLDVGATLRNLHALSTRQIQDFFIRSAKDRAHTTRGQIRAALRSFLNFCAKQGYVLHNLAEALPKLFTYKLANLPRNISEQDAQRVLESIDRGKPVGRRDFAIIQLLYTYGVRGAQVRALRLQDIQWSQNRIRFLAFKGGKQILEPLTEQVGESLLEYLRDGRPQTACPEVFLTVRAPLRPLEPTALYAIVAARMRQARVSRGVLGPHAFRHAFATRLLKHGQSLKTIADMLGHRSINSTFIYTKVDFEMLNQLGLDWPEV